MRTLRWVLFIPSGFLVGAIVGVLFSAVQALMDGTISQHGYGWQWGVGAGMGVIVGSLIAPSESKRLPATILVAMHIMVCGFAIWSDTTHGEGKRVMDYLFLAGGAILGAGAVSQWNNRADDGCDD